MSYPRLLAQPESHGSPVQAGISLPDSGRSGFIARTTSAIVRWTSKHQRLSGLFHHLSRLFLQSVRQTLAATIHPHTDV